MVACKGHGSQRCGSRGLFASPKPPSSMDAPRPEGRGYQLSPPSEARSSLTNATFAKHANLPRPCDLTKHATSLRSSLTMRTIAERVIVANRAVMANPGLSMRELIGVVARPPRKTEFSFLVISASYLP